MVLHCWFGIDLATWLFVNVKAARPYSVVLGEGFDVGDSYYDSCCVVTYDEIITVVFGVVCRVDWGIVR